MKESLGAGTTMNLVVGGWRVEYSSCGRPVVYSDLSFLRLMTERSVIESLRPQTLRQ